MSKTITVPLNEWQDLNLEIERLEGVNKELVKGKVVLKVSDFNLKAGLMVHDSVGLQSVLNHSLFGNSRKVNIDNLRLVDFDYISKESHFKIIEQYKLAISENLDIKVQDITWQDRERSKLIETLESDLNDAKDEILKGKDEILKGKDEILKGKDEILKGKVLVKKLTSLLFVSFILNVTFMVMQ